MKKYYYNTNTNVYLMQLLRVTLREKKIRWNRLFAPLDHGVHLQHSYLYFYRGYTSPTNLGAVVNLPWQNYVMFLSTSCTVHAPQFRKWCRGNSKLTPLLEAKENVRLGEHRTWGSTTREIGSQYIKLGEFRICDTMYVR